MIFKVTEVVDMTNHVNSLRIVTVHSPQSSAVDYHQLWAELHTQVETPEQFADWVKRVPSFGCSCASWLRTYLKDNPPTEDLREYGWKLHNAVNAKLGKVEFSWLEFEAKYQLSDF